MANLYNLLLMLDGAIYNLIDYLYDIFDFLAGRNIFSQDTYNDIVSRIYIILGVFMLFVLAYSLLKAIINPDDFAKGENSFPNLIKNVVVSLVIIVLLPTVFSVAFNIQNSILNNDTIPKLILGTDYATNTDVYDADAGRTMAYYTFMAFFHENEDWCGNPEVNGTGTVLTVGDGGSCADEILGNGALFVQNGLPLSEIRAGVLREDSFSNFSEFGEAVEAGQINYMFIISTFAGLFIVYVLLNFCFDMALRVIKLAFYQIIAPIPVICRILPGGNMKDVFSNWTKQVISIFFEVFIRIGIMNLGVFLITTIVKNFNGIPGLSRLTFTQELIVQALLIMGVVTFIRQAPDLLSKLLKLDTGGMKLGLMDKLAMGGGLVAGAAVGGLATTGIRNAVSGGRNVWNNAKKIPQSVKNAQGVRAKTKAILGGAGGVAGSLVGGALSTVAGAGSGFVRGGFAGRGAKNFKDMRGAASTAAKGAAEARTKRENYKAAHRKKIPVFGGIIGAGLGHGADLLGSAGRFVGLGNIDALRAENAAMAEITDAEDAFNNEFESTLLKNLNKGKTSLAGANLSTFSAAKQRLDQARLSGVNVAGAEKAYKDAIKDVQKSLHNKLYSSQSNWNKLSQDDQIALGQLRVKATEYRGAIMNNSSLQALRDAGIVGSDFAMNKDVSESVFYDPVDANGNAIRDAQGNVIKSVVSKMGDNIKLHTASNDVNISAIKQKNTDEN